ncbi:hypothetical protein B1R32_11019 [Abditibacterium utsteinense]|uniref:Uncharacterized protein n=1 Tax=Abditibacterium utsteinense TaxID=1960156 RepID=A0A2S8SS04_9BACT|nr:hypothetical protein [Abditibacterium utsteinense]PQV63556.1 hypothetical protein B1R32_11019 [Abditibacterium utsteinense]
MEAKLKLSAENIAQNLGDARCRIAANQMKSSRENRCATALCWGQFNAPLFPDFVAALLRFRAVATGNW